MQAESGDLSVYAETVSKDEIGELATFLNRMLKSLRTFDALKTRELAIARAKLSTIVANTTNTVFLYCLSKTSVMRSTMAPTKSNTAILIALQM